MPDTEHKLALPAGSVIDKYRTETILGYGGFGIVYKGVHQQLDKPVAIKEYLPQELATRDGTTVRPLSTREQEAYQFGKGRFLAEAKQLVRFGHNNIVRCNDFIEANGTAYLIMDYEDGLPMSDLLRLRESQNNPLTEAEIKQVMLPLLDGLTAVHDHDVLHRDIKPANIFIRRSTEQPVLIDFGAAKHSYSEHSKSMAPYTEGYAAVEQVEQSGNLGPWTDIYAIGAVMWRVISGGDPPKVEMRLSAMVRGNADPMTAAKEIGSGKYSDALLETIDKCLQIKEEDRFQTVSDLSETLRTGVITQSGDDPAARTRWRKRAMMQQGGGRARRAPVYAAVATAAMVAVAGVAYWQQDAVLDALESWSGGSQSAAIEAEKQRALEAELAEQRRQQQQQEQQTAKLEEQLRQAEEDRRRLEAEKKLQEEAAKLAEQRRQAEEERRRLEAEKAALAEQKREQQAAAKQAAAKQAAAKPAPQPRQERQSGGDVGEGPYQDGKRHGEWTWRYAGGDVHKGTYVNGRRHGKWFEQEADGDIAEGPYVDGKRHGEWTWRFANGNVAEGAFVNGVTDGSWTWRYVDGAIHQGPYPNKARAGEWEERDANGDVAKGSYKNNRRDGEWVFRLADGTVRRGAYANGNAQGKWIIDYANGDAHEGTYAAGVRQGEWVERGAGGDVKEGPYVGGKRQGTWVWRFPDGNEYEGPYVNNQRHGEWTWRDPDGYVRHVLFVRGVQQAEQEDAEGGGLSPQESPASQRSRSFRLR